VYIEYSSHRLHEAGISLSEANKLFGVPVGRKYIQRLAILRATEKFTELFGHRALKLQQLKGDRSGEYALTLTGNFRLILAKIKENTVRIIDVEDYHGN
jgi:proteic killer suppression protein